MFNDSKILFTKKEKIIRYVWLGFLAMPVVIPLAIIITDKIIFGSSDSGISEEITVMFLITAAQSGVLWYCGYLKNGTKLLKCVVKCIGPVGLVRAFSSLAREVERMEPILDSFIGIMINALCLWFSWLVYKINLSKKNKDVFPAEDSGVEIAPGSKS